MQFKYSANIQAGSFKGTVSPPEEEQVFMWEYLFSFDETVIKSLLVLQVHMRQIFTLTKSHRSADDPVSLMFLLLQSTIANTVK